MKYKNWSIPAAPPVIPPALLSAGYSPLLSAILALRGMDTPDAAKEFLFGEKELLSDPFSLADMVPAVQRLQRAINNGEHIAVYGDYDVDGITSACLLTDYLRSRGLTVETYIPDRIEEGYGLNCAAIDRLHQRGVTLIVTVDCGVTNLAETAYANSLGLDMVITDHHECREELPDAEAVVNTKRQDNISPALNLAGVGVAFKLVCALSGQTEAMLSRYCDLVAVGTVADVMLLTGENRYTVRRGLEKLASDECLPGLRALMLETGAADKRLTASTIGYNIAPRINAAGRLGDTQAAVELLQTRSLRRAAELAQELCRRNQERQQLELRIWQEAETALGECRPDGPIVLAARGWHQGVIGIAASRLTDKFAVPAVMICLDGERGKGSCRSVGGFNLYEALTACSDCLEGFGGHAMAAGLTIRPERVDELRERLGEYYRAHPVDYVPALEADLLVDDPVLLSEECVTSLDRLEPCGNGNPRPLLCITDAVLVNVTPIGGGKHLRLRLSKFDQSYECVFFSQTAEKLGAAKDDRVDVIFSPQINEFRSQCSVQLVLSDLRPHRD